jgi:hypothetical protein
MCCGWSTPASSTGHHATTGAIPVMCASPASSCSAPGASSPGRPTPQGAVVELVEIGLAAPPASSGYRFRRRGQCIEVQAVRRGSASVHLSHCNLTGGEQCPEQHGCSFRRGQNGLRLDAAGHRRSPSPARRARPASARFAGFGNGTTPVLATCWLSKLS